MTSTSGRKPKPPRQRPAATATARDDAVAALRRPPAHELRVRVGARRWRTDWPDALAVVERAARAALAGRRESCEVSVLLTDDKRMRALNRDYRGMDKPTNVLAFALDDAAPAGTALVLGDVVLALETIGREAAEQGKPPGDHLAHLTVHGVLHLCGYDHLDGRQARRMEAAEIAVLAGLGIDNPYIARLA